MSIRKHYVPDFVPFIDLLKKNGFDYINYYRKAEALIGESNTIDLIDMYFHDSKRRSEMNKLSNIHYRTFFLNHYVEARQWANTSTAFDETVKLMAKDHEFYEREVSVLEIMDKIKHDQLLNTIKEADLENMQAYDELFPNS